MSQTSSFSKIKYIILDYIKYIYFYYLYLYNIIIKKNNSIKFNTEHWEQYVFDVEDGASEYWTELGKERILGDYAFIKEYMQKNIIDKTVIDLGSLTGIWTARMLDAKKIWCVDLNETGFKFIQKKMDTSKISFYKTKGDELLGIPDNSVDFIFSMDTLVRAPKSAIEAYFSEFNRVLKEGGKTIIHLPCTIKLSSNSRGFTRLSLQFILDMCKNNNFNTTINFSVITHGVLVMVEKNSSKE